jgi:hypothetical protein
MFAKKTLVGGEVTTIHAIKEVKNNHMLYKSMTDRGVISIYRIEGFDPQMLNSSEQVGILQTMMSVFEAKFRYKIIACQIKYNVPLKEMALDIDAPGINFAKNMYTEVVNDLNSNTTSYEQAYFLVLESSTAAINDRNWNLMAGQASGCHITIRPANDFEISQVMNVF